MSQKISAMPVLTALTGDEILAGITDALQNVGIPVSLLTPPTLLVSMYGNNSTYIYTTTQWNDWTGSVELTSPHAEWSEYDKALVLNTSGVYRIRMTTRIDAVDDYDNPAAMPLNMNAGTLMNNANSITGEMVRSSIALTGDAQNGYNDVTSGQWTDEYIILARADDMVYPQVHWKPMDSQNQRLNIQAHITVELLKARNVVVPA